MFPSIALVSCFRVGGGGSAVSNKEMDVSAFHCF
jgi:hypothetical protein